MKNYPERDYLDEPDWIADGGLAVVLVVASLCMVAIVGILALAYQ